MSKNYATAPDANLQGWPKGVPYIIGMDEGGKHISTGISFKEIPDYPALKAQAIDILTKRAAGQPVEGASSAPTP